MYRLPREHLSSEKHYTNFYEKIAATHEPDLSAETFVARWSFLLGELCLLPPRICRSAIEVGCLTGYICNSLYSRGLKPVVGIDVSPTFIEKAKTRYQGPDFYCLFLEKAVDVLAQKFDVVIAMEVLEHLDNIFQGIDAISRLTVPGGLAVISIPLDYPGWGEHVWIIEKKDCGLFISFFEKQGFLVNRAEVRSGSKCFSLLLSLRKEKENNANSCCCSSSRRC